MWAPCGFLYGYAVTFGYLTSKAYNSIMRLRYLQIPKFVWLPISYFNVYAMRCLPCDFDIGPSNHASTWHAASHYASFPQTMETVFINCGTFEACTFDS